MQDLHLKTMTPGNLALFLAHRLHNSSQQQKTKIKSLMKTRMFKVIIPLAGVLSLPSVTQADIFSFNSLTKNGNIYLLGDGGSVGVNVNAASWALSAINGSNAGTGFTPGPYS